MNIIDYSMVIQLVALVFDDYMFLFKMANITVRNQRECVHQPDYPRYHFRRTSIR